MKAINTVKFVFPSVSANEGFARSAVAAFAAQTDPPVDLLADVKTAVSEAVTNCIVHAYPDCVGLIYITVTLYADRLRVRIADKGVGIADIPRAMQPAVSDGNGERAGLGFTVMQTFMDQLKVRSAQGRGTVVTMEKFVSRRSET